MALAKPFSEVDDDIKLNIASESSPLKRGLCALTLAHDCFGIERMSVGEIVEALDTLGSAVSEMSLTRAFNASREKVRSTEQDGVTKYKAMIRGRQQIEYLLEVSGPKVVYVQSGEYRTARERLRDMLAELSGVIRICDPYYGAQSLHVLQMIPDTCDVRFLTGTASGSTSLISSSIPYFQKEYPHISMRIYPQPNDLHDRYLIEEDQFWLLGHGIKDIGNKESFIVRIKSDHASDLIADVTTTFDRRWALATPM